MRILLYIAALFCAVCALASTLCGVSCVYGQDAGYARYTGTGAFLNTEMDYIAGWESSQARGSHGAYEQVVFFDPGSAGGDFRAGMILTVEEVSRTFSGAATLEEFVNSIVELRRKLTDYQEASRADITISGTDAVVLECSYKIPQGLHGEQIELMPVRERIAAVKKNGSFYTIRYLNKEFEFGRFAPSFSHILQTIRLDQQR